MGHDVNLTCAIIHLTPFVDTIVNITFSWTHNDAELVSDQKRISIINDPTRSTLLISSVNQNFSGEYKCDVSIEDVNSQSGAVGMIAAEYVILPATISRVIQIAIQGTEYILLFTKHITLGICRLVMGDILNF